MNSLLIDPIACVLKLVFEQAETADRSFREALNSEGGETRLDEQIGKILDEKARDYKAVYLAHAGNYLNVSPEFGKFLYMCARTRRASRIAEFGTSFGVSAIYLACALHDNGGGRLIGTELEASKAAAANGNLAAAGLADIVDIRIGDALETLKDGIDGDIDMVHLDGAFSPYLPVLRILEPHLKPGALVIGENSFGNYIDYVPDPRNGYASHGIAVRARTRQ